MNGHVQSVILLRSMVDGFSEGGASTYLGGGLQFVSSVDAVDIIPINAVTAANVLYGERAADVRDSLTTWISGLQGEVLLNFAPVGFFGVVLPFAILLGAPGAHFHRAPVRQRFGLTVIAHSLTLAIKLLFVRDVDNVIRDMPSVATLPILGFPVAPYSPPGRSCPRSRGKGAW